MNNFAAMAPAIAGVGRCTNSKGTTKNPRVQRLAHHSAATQIDNLDIRSDVAHRDNFIAFDTARGLDYGSVALLLAN